MIRRGLLEQPSVEALRAEVGHEYSHTFKPPTATVVVVALAALLVAELATLVVSLSSHAPLRAVSLGVSFLASGAGGGALILRLSQREELRADRQAAELLGSAGPVIAMLEQVRGQTAARSASTPTDGGCRTGCLPPTRPSRSVSGRC